MIPELGEPVASEATPDSSTGGEAPGAVAGNTVQADDEQLIVEPEAANPTEPMTPADDGAATAQWIANEIDEITSIARSIDPGDLDVGDVPGGSGAAEDFSSFFVSAEIGEGEGETGDPEAAEAEKPVSDGFMGKFLAMMRAGLGVQSRDDEEGSGAGQNKWKR